MSGENTRFVNFFFFFRRKKLHNDYNIPHWHFKKFFPIKVILEIWYKLHKIKNEENTSERWKESVTLIDECFSVCRCGCWFMQTFKDFSCSSPFQILKVSSQKFNVCSYTECHAPRFSLYAIREMCSWKFFTDIFRAQILPQIKQKIHSHIKTQTWSILFFYWAIWSLALKRVY